MLCVTEEAVQLRDLGSTNGTLINGKRLMGERMLAHGDQIQVGPLVFQVRLEPGLVDTGNFSLDTDVVPILSADQEQTVTAPNIADDARTSQT
jgi:pSer/pThr/pTyr-binding forkhead associated (FHA) protein